MAIERSADAGTQAAAPWPAVTAALAVGSVALLIPGLQPILLGELVARHALTLEGVGIVAMGEIIALGLGVVLGNALLPPGRLRQVCAAAALFVAVADVATLRLSGDAALAGMRALCGLGEGVLVWVTTSIIVRARAPDRLAGIFLVSQTLAQAAVAALLAWVVIPAAGWQGGFAVLAALTLALLAVARWLPAHLTALVAPGSARLPLTGGTVLSCLVVICQMAAIGSLWAYLDPLGRAAGYDGTAVQLLVALVLLFQVLGGSAAAVLVRRSAAVPVLLAGALLQAACAWSIHAIAGPAVERFAVSCAAFGFIWMFVMPFHVRLAFAADPAGRVAMLVPALQLLGVALGPLAAALFVAGDDARPVPAVCAAFALAAAVLLVPGLGRHARPPPPAGAAPAAGKRGPGQDSNAIAADSHFTEGRTK